MAKKDDNHEEFDFEYVTTELERIHPEKGDIFILNVDTEDPDVLYSDEIMQSVEQLSTTLQEFTGIKIPILVFGREIDLSIMSKDELLALIEVLVDTVDDDEEDEEEIDSEHLTDQFN